MQYLLLVMLIHFGLGIITVHAQEPIDPFIHDEVVKAMRDGIRPRNDSGRVITDSAQAYRALYRNIQAMYSHTVPLEPDEALVHFRRGVAKDSLGDRRGAVVEFTAAIKLRGDYANAYFKRGICRYILGEYRKAIADFTAVIKLMPDDAAAYENRGNARAELGDNRGAIADYTRAIRRSPGKGSAYYNRALAYRALDDHRNACADAKKASRYGFTVPPELLDECR